VTSSASPRRADIDSFYTCSHPDQFRINWRAFYTEAEQRTDAVRAEYPHELDTGYGPDVRQRLDLYLPRPAPHGTAPIVLFLHGGGFREGDPALYGYLAKPYVERGIAFASVGYRLTPETYLPETANDVEAALAWCSANLASRGVDHNRITLAGHSAGAILTAHVALRSDWLLNRGLPVDLIKAAVPISGVYDFTDTSRHSEMFANDADRQTASPLFNITAAAPPPMVVAVGELENRPDYRSDSHRLVDALRDRGASAEVLVLDQMDHADTANALGDEASPLFAAVTRFVSGALAY
jgi:arylformamidase